MATRGQRKQEEKDVGLWWCFDPDVAIGAGEEEEVEVIPIAALSPAKQEPGHSEE